MIIINVTQDDINKGIRESQKSCPIAKALKRRQKKKVYVGAGDYIEIGDGNYLYHSYIGINNKEIDRIDNFIDRFDSGKKVKSSQFKIKKDLIL